MLKSKSKICLMFVLLLIVVFIIPSLAAEDKNKNFKIDYDRLKNNPEIESNLLEKSGAFAAEIQIQNTIKVVFELKDSDKSYIKSLKDNGAVIEAVHKNLVQASVPSSQLQAMSGLPFVNHVRSPLRPYKDAVVSEGAGVINASLLPGIGVTGQNVKIAILDGGFEGYQLKPGTELPGSVTVRSFRADGDITGGGEVHGTAVAEIVYDVAPDASLYLINFDTDVEFANAVDYAIGQDVDIISMSVNWLVGPFDGTGYIDEIVDNATSSGIVWVNSAGNFARKHWEGKFSGNGDDWHDFIPGDELMSLGYFGAETPVAVFLSWDDRHVSYQDYDMYLINSSYYIVGWSKNDQSAGYPPYEKLEVTVLKPGNYYLAIHKYQATREVNFELYSYYQELEHQVASSSLGIPADARGVIAVGATHWSNDGLEPFSSQGPTNDGRTKPDAAAPDGVSTFTYGTGNFYGTSASAPHAAGAAALLMSAYPSIPASQVRSVLENTAKDLLSAGYDNLTGFGRIDVNKAFLMLRASRIGIVTRSLPTIVAPNATVVVTITPSTNLSTSPAWGVDETIPAGFMFINTTASWHTTTDGVNRFTKMGSSAFTYTLTAPALAGNYTFNGTFVDGDRNKGTVVGSETMTVGVSVIDSYRDPATGRVEKAAAINALNDYLFNQIISKEDAIAVLNAYLFGG